MPILLRLNCVAGILICASLTASGDDKTPAPKELQVLFVGNSQVYYNNLNKILEAIAESAPADRPRIRTDAKPSDRSIAGGASLESHWKRGTDKDTARGKIANEKWDFVILQDYSSTTSKEDFTKYGKLFDEVIREKGAKTIFLSTAHFPNQVPKGFLAVHERHAALAKELDVWVAGAGNAWLAYWGENPSQEKILYLYDKDKGHPGIKGSYIYACTLYAAITGKSPVGLTNRLPGHPADTIGPGEAKLFQEAAWTVHQEVNGKRALPKP